MAGVLLLFLMFTGSPLSYGTQTPQKSLVGCFNRTPEGALQFGAIPSGDLFALTGNTKLAEQHVNQLVRVFGNVNSLGSDNGAPSRITVARVRALAESCTSVLPATKLDGVPGKVGEDGVAVPLTDTTTEDRTTPGFQTGTVAGHSARAPVYRPSPELPAAPPHPEQIGQSEAAANVNASSVERTEIQPGSTLGVSGSYNASGTAEESGDAR